MKPLQILTNLRNTLNRFLRIHIVSTSYIDIWIDYCYKTKVQSLPRKGDVFWTDDKIVLTLEKELMKNNDWPEKWTWHKGTESQYVSFDDAIYVKEILFMDSDKSIHLTLNDSI